MSEFDWSKLRSATARHLIAALERDGFMFAAGRGSHRHDRHPDGRRVTVTAHGPRQTFRPKTLRSMIALQARWTADDLRRLKLLR